VIVSLDGPREVHDRIRRITRAFDLLAAGVRAIHAHKPDFPIAARCTIQRENFSRLRETVRTARILGLQSISFLAADLTSEAFNRPQGWPPERQSLVALTAEEVNLLEHEIEALIDEQRQAPGFVLETPEKLRRIVHHFRAHLGLVEGVAPRCNAPWVSAVVESDGTVRPCFFHKPLGNITGQSLREVLNGPKAIEFRKELDISRDPVCRRCVCSLYLSPMH
jgi:MoaA/NifB/PqqE/SkfB family radical SAM enzyme